MSDEFLTNDFFLKLIRLGVECPDLKDSSKKILLKITEEKKKTDPDNK